MDQPPRRPIVLGNDCLTKSVSQLVDDYLHLHVLSLPSYKQDTINLLKILDSVYIPTNSWLVAIDVEALLNSIPHDSGVGVVEGFISQRAIQSLCP